MELVVRSSLFFLSMQVRMSSVLVNFVLVVLVLSENVNYCVKLGKCICQNVPCEAMCLYVQLYGLLAALLIFILVREGLKIYRICPPL